MDSELLNRKLAADTEQILRMLEAFGERYKAEVEDAKLNRKRVNDTLEHARTANENSLKAKHSAESAEHSAHRAAVTAERMESQVDMLRGELADATGRMSELQLTLDRVLEHQAIDRERQQAFELKVFQMLGQVITGQENLVRETAGPVTNTQDGADQATSVAAADPA